MKTAFVLGGGGVLGAHEVGMLRALSQAGIAPDLVVGTSVGAINGVFVAADPAGGAVRRLANGDWFVRGHVAVSDLEDYGLELPVDTDAYNSVGGFVFAELGRLPKRGDTIAANGYSIRVESVRQNRIEAVRIRRRRDPANASGIDRPAA